MISCASDVTDDKAIAQPQAACVRILRGEYLVRLSYIFFPIDLYIDTLGEIIEYSYSKIVHSTTLSFAPTFANKMSHYPRIYYAAMYSLVCLYRRRSSASGRRSSNCIADKRTGAEYTATPTGRTNRN